MLFYYDELYHAAIDRMNKLVEMTGEHKQHLLRRLRNHAPSLLITTEDIDLVTQKIITSLGAVLCPQAAADYAGVSKMLEMDIHNNED
jgi:hypothetical protein